MFLGPSCESKQPAHTVQQYWHMCLCQVLPQLGISPCSSFATSYHCFLGNLTWILTLVSTRYSEQSIVCCCFCSWASAVVLLLSKTEESKVCWWSKVKKCQSVSSPSSSSSPHSPTYHQFVTKFQWPIAACAVECAYLKGDGLCSLGKINFKNLWFFFTLSSPISGILYTFLPYSYMLTMLFFRWIIFPQSRGMRLYKI